MSNQQDYFDPQGSGAGADKHRKFAVIAGFESCDDVAATFRRYPNSMSDGR